MLNHTIAAISTPNGVGALCVIRVSGENAVEISNKLTDRDLFLTESNKMLFSRIHFLNTEKILDEAMLCIMRAPNSFTGEDTVEFFCHGGMMVGKTLLKELIKAGCRMAAPGEYTKRAFLNGKLDLIKAESIGDIIHAKTESSFSLAANQMLGGLSDKINSCYEKLLLLAAHIAAVLDYPEEGVPDISSLDAEKKIREISNELEKLLKNSDNGIITMNGLNVVIVGKPNVGKSSLLNNLLGEDRAIVTDIAGTTRDVLKEQANIGGYLINISDTAGIRQTDDIVEKQGVDRSISGIAEADLILLVLDQSRSLDDDDNRLIELTKDKKRFIILNKCDIDKKMIDVEGIFADSSILSLSAKNNIGTDTLCEKIRDFASQYEVSEDSVAVTNLRQQELIISTLGILNNIDFDLITVDLLLCELEAAISVIGEVTGKNVSESIIEKVFENFCVGK